MALRAVPLLGAGFRYLKRLAVLPWNFHTVYQWWAAESERTDRAVADAVAAFERRLDAKLEAVGGSLGNPLAELAAELRRLNDCHAGCYDLVVEQLREQAALLRELATGEAPSADHAARLAELSEAQAELARRLDELARRLQSDSARVISHNAAA
jgi:chromosome segregation ATPase